jgi:hypothetical protein
MLLLNVHVNSFSNSELIVPYVKSLIHINNTYWLWEVNTRLTSYRTERNVKLK